MAVNRPKELVVGVDIGFANCGFAVIDFRTRGIVRHLTVVTSSLDPLETRLRIVWNHLESFISRPRVVAVGYEDPFRVGKAKLSQGKTNFNPLVLSRVQGYVESLAWRFSIPLFALEPSDVKLAVVPHGSKASKKQVRQAILRLSGLAMQEHEADATGAAYGAARRLSIQRSRR